MGGKPAPVIDGFTGEQRFYLGWVQVWRGKVREAEAINGSRPIPHSPPAVRGTAPLRNQPGFYEAFGVKPGDKMYLPPAQRVDDLVGASVEFPGAWAKRPMPSNCRRMTCDACALVSSADIRA